MPKIGDEYLDTVRRIEPDVHMLDRDGSLASIAISLKRIADTLDGTVAGICVTETIFGGRKSDDH